MWPRADAGRRAPEPPAPGCRRGWSATRTAERQPAGLRLLRRRRQPARSGPPAPPPGPLAPRAQGCRRESGAADAPAPPVPTAASRSVRPRRDAPGRGGSRPRGRRGGPGRGGGHAGGAGRGRARVGQGAPRGRGGARGRGVQRRAAQPDRKCHAEPATGAPPRVPGRSRSRFPGSLGSPYLTAGPPLRCHWAEGMSNPVWVGRR